MSKKDLLALDFEGILKYFRVTLPKKYRSEKSARDLLAASISIKVKNLYLLLCICNNYGYMHIIHFIYLILFI